MIKDVKAVINLSEEARLPRDAVSVTRTSLFSLPVFNGGFCLRCSGLIALDNRRGNFVPQLSTLPILLVLQRADRARSVLGAMSIEQEFLFACFQVFHPHFFRPFTGDLVERLAIGDVSSYLADDGVIRAIDKSLDFEFDVADKIGLLAPNPAMVTEFKLHSAKKNASAHVSIKTRDIWMQNLAYIFG